MKTMSNTFTNPHEAGQDIAAEHEATLELVELGMKLADRGISISAAAIHAWMRDEKDTPFPEPDTFE